MYGDPMTEVKDAQGTSRRGAGVLLLSDGHVVLGRRAAGEHDPGTWACFGGMAEGDETPLECAVREVREEAGVALDPRLLRAAYEFVEGNGFRFTTYLADVGDEFVPAISAETHEASAFRLGTTIDDLWSSLPSPLHPGMAALAADPNASAAVLRAVTALRARAAAPRADVLPGPWPGTPGR